MPQRCFLGCLFDTSVSRHHFPHPMRNPERFKAWVHIVGGKLESPKDYDFFRKKLICDIHFTDKDKNRNNRLNFLAVPSLHLPGKADDVTPMEVIPISDYEPTLVEPTKSKSGVIDAVSTMEVIPVPDFGHVFNKPSTSNHTTLVRNNSTNIIPVPVHEPEWNQPPKSEQIKIEHNYCILRKKATKRIKGTTRQRLMPSLLLDKLHISRRRIKILQSEIIRSRRRTENFKLRLASADKMSTDVLLQKMTKNMTTAAKIFTKMQYTQTHKKPSGRRFTMEEKVLSLSMYKRSPKSYTLLAKYFTLPSAKSLKRLLAKIEVEPGLNKTIFLKMKQTVKDLSREDRLCSLIFDEMSISPQVNYDCAKDKLKGFSFDHKKIADHVLVFMVKGIRKKFKQPVAYYFTNSMKHSQLKNVLKKVINYVQGTGLNVLCTVCDQCTTNVSAINSIIADTKKMYLKTGKEWKNDIMEVGKAKIIPLFDVPHLLKGIRNNLLTKDLKYFDFEEEKEKIIKWDYYRQIYEADKSYGELKLLQKLTDEHIYPEKIKKMKVKVAAQVFSHSVAVVAEHLTARGDLPEECRDIIPFTILIDNVFDSLNSNSFDAPDGKMYKRCVRRNSHHHELWQNALKVLDSVKFIKKVKEKDNKIRFIETKAVPSIKNFIRTIKGMQYLWQILSLKYSFDAMLTRNLNQDPLENFFGNIRSYGARNTAPNTVSFEGAYKSLLLNNFNSPHSLHANCEKDENNCLQNLEFFVSETNELNSNVPTDIRPKVMKLWYHSLI